jgi:hypothetical protein
MDQHKNGKDVHIELEEHENILINVQYLINRRYVRLRCNLRRKDEPIKGRYRDQPPSAIYSTKAKTLEILMAEKFHRQKISFVDSSFIQSPYEAKR